MQLTTAEAARIFDKLRIQPKHSTHHIAGFLVVDGKKVLPLHYSHGRKSMPGHVPDRFRRAMHLDRDEFADMKRCHMKRDRYVEILREKGVV